MTITTTPTETPTTIEPDAPHALNRAWCDAFNAGDLGQLLAMYEPDAVLVPGPDADAVHGRDAIGAALSWFLSLGGRLDFTPRHWLVGGESGELALGSIAFVLTGGHDAEGNPVPLSGVTHELARRGPDGRWRYVVDHPFGGA